MGQKQAKHKKGSGQPSHSTNDTLTIEIEAIGYPAYLKQEQGKYRMSVSVHNLGKSEETEARGAPQPNDFENFEKFAMQCQMGNIGALSSVTIRMPEGNMVQLDREKARMFVIRLYASTEFQNGKYNKTLVDGSKYMKAGPDVWKFENVTSENETLIRGLITFLPELSIIHYHTNVMSINPN